jgi:hypothetical protein
MENQMLSLCVSVEMGLPILAGKQRCRDFFNIFVVCFRLWHALDTVV